MWSVVNATPRPQFNPGEDPMPIVYEAGWATGPVWKGAENLAPTRIRSPDRPARSESLYRLSYRGPQAVFLGSTKYFHTLAALQQKLRWCSLDKRVAGSQSRWCRKQSRMLTF